jgi:hypothetical protein
VRAMFPGMLVVVRMLVRAMRVLVCVLMVVDVAVLVLVFMGMRRPIMGVLMRMNVAVSMLMRMIVFVFAFHVSPRATSQPLDANPVADGTECCRR